MKKPFVMKEHPLGIAIWRSYPTGDKLVCIVKDESMLDSIHFALLDEVNDVKYNMKRKWFYENDKGHLFDSNGNLVAQ